ncbi:MAG: glycosyltransferase family 2 protein [Candidatus Omnitrophica bacterium]|nr:glycosyltransferase family 2 protein [Candidatus Omnitrophota bacterium]
MTTLIILCGVSLSVLLYIYAGYPIVVWVLARLFGREPRRRGILPMVSLLIPAYNEEAHIEAKLRNSLRLDYPRDRLEIVVASDGSTDRTNDLVRRFRGQRVRLVAMRRHAGKSALVNLTLPRLRGEVVAFSDVSSELERDALRRLVRSFADRRVGCVSGLYRLGHTGDLRSQGEGLYWRYETFIKRQESRLHSILGAHGAFYAIRRPLFQPLDDAAINDDYLIPMRIVAQGYRAVYEPRAVAWEREQTSVRGEFARRRRIAVGNCQQIVTLRHLLHPRHGWPAFLFFSHKVLRTAAPLFMLALAVSSLQVPTPWAAVLVGLQALFYGSAVVGYLCQRRGRMVKWLSPPLYFCLGNLAMLAGLLKYSFDRRRLVWERAR